MVSNNHPSDKGTWSIVTADISGDNTDLIWSARIVIAKNSRLLVIKGKTKSKLYYNALETSLKRLLTDNLIH